jgi:hypothetical protein
VTGRDRKVRLIGLGMVALGLGACLWLRELMTPLAAEPTLLEAGLVLASFVLSLGGLAAILNGERLFDPPHPPEGRRDRRHRPTGYD